MQIKASDLCTFGASTSYDDVEIIMDTKLNDNGIKFLGDNVKGRIDFICTSTDTTIATQLPSKLSLLMNNISAPVQLNPTTWRSTIVKKEPIPLLIDEDDLLVEEDKLGGGCDTLKEGEVPKEKKRACKDCSCGLKEFNDSTAAAAAAPEAPSSSCGSCYLGDAFRCSSCPYKGLPPFKEGEVVALDSTTFLEDDI